MNLLEKLNKILDEERKCLLAGNYEDLERLADKKQELTQNISKQLSGINRDALSAIALKATKNDTLLESAQRGIKSAISHLKEASEDSFKSYSKEGSRSALSKRLTLRQKV